MEISEAKQKLNQIIGDLPEHKLDVVIDFANYLRSREEMEEFFRMQTGSKTYLDWVSSDNDIYDEVFKDEIKER